MQPRISVVIPSYNHAAFVGQAIESVLADPGEDLELIVVDDASPDSSRQVIAKYQDPRLRRIDLPKNRGISVGLNTGIAASTGEFISVLGSDDFLLPGTLRKQMTFLEGHPQYGAVFGMPRLVDEQGQPLNVGYREFTHPFGGRDASRTEWLKRFFLVGNCLCHPTSMLRRQVHQSVGLYDPRLLNLQDFDLWIRMLVSGQQFFVLPIELTGRRVRSGTQNLSAPSPTTVLRSTFENLQVLKRYRQVSAADLYSAFSNEVRSAGIAMGLGASELLAELAVRSSSGVLQLFGLQALFDGLGEQTDPDCKRLFALAGKMDPFAVLSQQTKRPAPSATVRSPR